MVKNTLIPNTSSPSSLCQPSTLSSRIRMWGCPCPTMIDGKKKCLHLLPLPHHCRHLCLAQTPLHRRHLSLARTPHHSCWYSTNHLLLNVDSTLFIFTNNKVILFNYTKIVVIRTFPMLSHGDPKLT